MVNGTTLSGRAIEPNDVDSQPRPMVPGGLLLVHQAGGGDLEVVLKDVLVTAPADQAPRKSLPVQLAIYGLYRTARAA